MMTDEQLVQMKFKLEGEGVPVGLKPALRQRVIVVDQGLKSLSLVAIDQSLKGLPKVVGAIERKSIENAYSKQLGKEFGTALQRQFDVRTCTVKMLQPHVHRRNGPTFQLGDEIREACKLEPAY
jgi:hypothetical protein